MHITKGILQTRNSDCFLQVLPEIVNILLEWQTLIKNKRDPPVIKRCMVQNRFEINHQITCSSLKIDNDFPTTQDNLENSEMAYILLQGVVCIFYKYLQNFLHKHPDFPYLG